MANRYLLKCSSNTSSILDNLGLDAPWDKLCCISCLDFRISSFLLIYFAKNLHIIVESIVSPPPLHVNYITNLDDFIYTYWNVWNSVYPWFLMSQWEINVILRRKKGITNFSVAFFFQFYPLLKLFYFQFYLSLFN